MAIVSSQDTWVDPKVTKLKEKHDKIERLLRRHRVGRVPSGEEDDEEWESSSSSKYVERPSR